MRSYKGKKIRDIVDNPKWQRLRESFLGTWKKTPKENVRALRNYLGDMPSEMKLVRVYNYLTGSAFRIGIISSPEIEKLRTEVKKRLDSLK